MIHFHQWNVRKIFLLPHQDNKQIRFLHSLFLHSLFLVYKKKQDWCPWKPSVKDRGNLYPYLTT